MSDYRYIFGSLRNEIIIAEINLFGTFLTMEMNVGGQLNGSFILDQTGKRNQDLIDATLPGKTFCAVERNGIPIWIGAVWSRTYQSQAKEVQLFCQSFETYPAKQIIDQDISITNTEQLTIFKSLWTTMQADNGRNININIPTTVSPTIVRKDIEVLATDNKFYGEVMSSLSDAVDGFDWYITVVDDNGAYRKDLLIGYPTLGTPVDVGTTVLEYPGAILNYYQTDSMADAATDVFLLGAGEGSSMVTSHQTSPDLLASGWPRWDVAVSRKDIINQDIINSVAEQEMKIRKAPMSVIKASLKADVSPEFGSYSLGDAVKIRIQDARNPDGLSVTTRMLRWELRPGDSQGSEEVALVFEGDPDVK